MDFEKKVLTFLKGIAVLINLWAPGLGFLLLGKFKIGIIFICSFLVTFLVISPVLVSFSSDFSPIIFIFYIFFVIGSTIVLLTTEY